MDLVPEGARFAMLRHMTATPEAGRLTALSHSV